MQICRLNYYFYYSFHRWLSNFNYTLQFTFDKIEAENPKKKKKISGRRIGILIWLQMKPETIHRLALFNDTVSIIERVGQQCSTMCTTQCSSRVSCHNLNCEIIHIEILLQQENAFRENIPCDVHRTLEKARCHIHFILFFHTLSIAEKTKPAKFCDKTDGKTTENVPNVVRDKM